MSENLSLHTDSNSISSKVGIIGRGRAATHLIYYLKSAGHEVVQWHRDMDLEELKKHRDCSLNILALSDSAIANFVTQHSWLLDHELIHLSGSFYSPFIKGIHPLVSFGSKLFDLDFYKRIPFVVEKQNAFDFKKYFPNLGNPILSVESEDKARYHAFCVAASNFTTILWQRFFQAMDSEFEISPQMASSLFFSTFSNIKTDWKAALTGPLARNDLETIERNLLALANDDLQVVYEAFVKAFGKKAREKIIYTYMEPGELGL